MVRRPGKHSCPSSLLTHNVRYSDVRRASEKFLQQMVALFVASHYKNTPNDLLLMSDAPAHQLFVLLPPVDQTSNTMPSILAVAQVGANKCSASGSFN